MIDHAIDALVYMIDKKRLPQLGPQYWQDRRGRIRSDDLTEDNFLTSREGEKKMVEASEIMIDGVRFINKNVVDKEYVKKAPEPIDFRYNGIGFTYDGEALTIGASDCKGKLHLYSADSLEGLGERIIKAAKEYSEISR